MSNHTARFWVYHGGYLRGHGYHMHGYDCYGMPRGSAGGWVKLSIPVGGRVTLCCGGPHDEGYSYTTREYFYRNGVVTCHSYTSARDCDGPLETWSHTEADINSRTPNRFDDNMPARVLDFQRVSSRQRDHYAEAMGY